jgi:hypothetical protein
MASSFWKYTLALFISLITLVLCVLTLFLFQVDPYTNMSAAQADAQDERWVSAQVAACQQAGGYPQADGTAMYCSVSFQQPDTSWYVAPISNPNYEAWEILQPLLIVLACALVIVGSTFLSLLFLCLRTERKARQCA